MEYMYHIQTVRLCSVLKNICFTDISRFSTVCINTMLGCVKGKMSISENGQQFYSFKGIPYAKPPVGDLRFAVPQPPDCWEDVKDCTQDCDICAQMDKATGTVKGSEDCLFLNVYTTNLEQHCCFLLPVMVFIHGGGFISGDGTDSTTHGPDFLMGHDVVLVAFNYRVGVLGFLSLNHKEAPGNMGLRDQVQALKWVRENIACFGGNPGNVTIFGISAGGASVEYLLLSPLAKGLFHKAISQSGSSLQHWAHNDKVEDLALKIPALNKKFIKNNDEVLKYLKEMPINELIKSSLAAINAFDLKGGLYFGFVPTIENPTDWEPFINHPTYQMLEKGDFTKVPYMSGICSREGLLMILRGKPKIEKLVKEREFLDHFPFDFDDMERTKLKAKLSKIYLERVETIPEKDNFAVDFFSDVSFISGSYTASQLIAKHNSPVYFYEFAYDGSLNDMKICNGLNRKGACHGDDSGYLLKSDKLSGQLSKTDIFIKNLMVNFWTNFAKFGNPNPKKALIGTQWKPVTKTKPACFVIDVKPYMKYTVYPERIKLYEVLYKKNFSAR